MELIRIVRCDPVKRNQRSAAATFDRGGITALVGHEMLERSQKKRTQAALFLSHGLEIFAFQNQREEPLGEIFRLLWLSTLSPNKTINRPPISAAKIFQGRLCGRSGTFRFQDHAPVGGSKRECFVLRTPTQPSPRSLTVISRHAAIKNKTWTRIKPAGNRQRLDPRRRRPYPFYAGSTVESVTSLSIVCLKTFSTVAPIFEPSRSTIQTCWPS